MEFQKERLEAYKKILQRSEERMEQRCDIMNEIEYMERWTEQGRYLRIIHACERKIQKLKLEQKMKKV
jgi:hypothetical protein